MYRCNYATIKNRNRNLDADSLEKKCIPVAANYLPSNLHGCSYNCYTCFYMSFVSVITHLVPWAEFHWDIFLDDGTELKDSLCVFFVFFSVVRFELLGGSG